MTEVLVTLSRAVSTARINVLFEFSPFLFLLVQNLLLGIPVDGLAGICIGPPQVALLPWMQWLWLLLVARRGSDL